MSRLCLVGSAALACLLVNTVLCVSVPLAPRGGLRTEAGAGGRKDGRPPGGQVINKESVVMPPGPSRLRRQLIPWRWVVTFRRWKSNAQGRPGPWWPRHLVKDRSQGRRAGPALARVRKAAATCSPALCGAGPDVDLEATPGGPLYRTFLHVGPEPRPGTVGGLCLRLGWLRPPSQPCGHLGTQGPICLYPSGILRFS